MQDRRCFKSSRLLTLQRIQNSKIKVSMNKSKCPTCGSSHTMKNSVRNGIQTYKCRECGCQFRNSRLPADTELWSLYQCKKQTVSELSSMFKTSESTIKRRLHNIKKEWVQPPLHGSGYVHFDATYWGQNRGVMLALDEESGLPLYISFIKNYWCPLKL